MLDAAPLGLYKKQDGALHWRRGGSLASSDYPTAHIFSRVCSYFALYIVGSEFQDICS